jgi:anti-sigma-K factor RskA
MICDDIEELSGAYVLDAVTDEERQVVDAHLPTCQKCSQLIAELRSVVDLLPFAVPQVEPSPGLKDRVLRAIADEKAITIPSTQLTPAILQPPRTAQIQPIRRRSTQQRWGTQLIAAAAILFFLISGGLVAWNVSLQHQLSTISANAPITYPVKSALGNASVTGQVTYYPQQHVTVVVVYGLTQTQGTQVYQGWLLQGKQPTSIGLLNVQNGVATIEYHGDIQQYTAAAVSLETGPSATPDAPKGTVVAIAPLSKS